MYGGTWRSGRRSRHGAGGSPLTRYRGRRRTKRRSSGSTTGGSRSTRGSAITRQRPLPNEREVLFGVSLGEINFAWRNGDGNLTSLPGLTEAVLPVLQHDGVPVDPIARTTDPALVPLVT